MNNYMLFQILLHLPVRSLLRFISVCKFWYYIIDSSHFKYQHTLRLNNKNDEEKQVSINLLDNGKSLKSHDSYIYLRVVSEAVKGLVCLSSPCSLDIAICNPFLGQFKILPVSPTYSQRHHINHQVVGLGFHEDYKVVQLLSSLEPRCLHANLYLAMTDSWRKLDLDPNLVINEPIKSVCKNGSFAHWKGQNTSELWKLKIYELSCEGSELIWNNVNNVELRSFSAAPPIRRINDIPIWWIDDIPIRKNDNCVVLRELRIRNDYIPIGMNYNTDCQSGKVILYDYRARKLIGCFKMHESSNTIDNIIEYEGSFVSP
ncbi:F-box protein At3g49510-like [Salvia hispanica]|uniref:F-box protein At3g49510-like n=1 Tax=Salvia hispanica TaxID=49212 RepID=UPI00200907F5|nr:F-box protein At3g49510-like [Salvia hispanica]